jgi:ADP-ribose pyrophosphatase YjhB (NUDIX family)
MSDDPRQGAPGARIRYCSYCGAEVVEKIPPADNRPRHVCVACAAVHYQNPKVVAGCVPEWDGKVLLCRRAIAPRYGLWTLPAGFMELGESSVEAAMRETYEEARARVVIDGLFAVFNLLHVNQLYLMFRARLADGEFSPGAESLEVKLFAEREIPWQELAFATIRHTLELYYEDRRHGRYRVHTGDIIRTAGGYDFRRGPES